MFTFGAADSFEMHLLICYNSKIVNRKGSDNLKLYLGKKTFKLIDWFSLIIVFLIVAFSLISLTNVLADPFTGQEQGLGDIFDNLNLSNVIWQGLFFLIGLVAIAVILLFDYNILRDWVNIIYWANIVLLVAVLLFGSNQRGATGWFMIGSRGFQPSELAKIAIIITLSKMFADKTENGGQGIQTWRELWPLLWRFALPFAIIIAQEDLGTALVYAVVFAVLLVVSKTSWKLILILAGVVICLLPLAWILLDDWQKNRILAFINPEADLQNSGYNVDQAKIAIGSGGLTGKGFFTEGALSQLNYVPEKHTDFLFSVTVEAVGFVGGLILILLYLVLLARLWFLSMRAKDRFGSYLIIGVMAMFLFHIVENIGMNMGVMPVTGIPLPFFSYGGSNMLTSMIAMGIVLNVNMRRNRTALA